MLAPDITLDIESFSGIAKGLRYDIMWLPVSINLNPFSGWEKLLQPDITDWEKDGLTPDIFEWEEVR